MVGADYKTEHPNPLEDLRNPDTGRFYLCIDLKSFYASVECVDRGLDPFKTNLVVADPTRTEKTICLAITPAMKAIGIRNRCRVFEIPEGIKYIMAPPRMQRYMDVSASIYRIYLRYVSPEDIHVYSIDECFIDATPYLKLYNTSAMEFAKTLMDAVFDETGICATCGVGTNMFLAKVALDITAKYAKNNIGYLDGETFRATIWDHKPITDIWNIGPGISRRLAKYGVYTLRGVCNMHEKTLYKEFGVNAEYLIDHAYGYEPCTIADIHAYVPQGHSLSVGQVLSRDYTFEEARTVIHEMIEQLLLDLVERGLVTESIGIQIGYKKGSLVDEEGQPIANRYGVPSTGMSMKLPWRTDNRKKIMPYFDRLYDKSTFKDVPIRRLNVYCGNVMPREFETLDLFTDVKAEEAQRKLQKTIIEVKKKFDKNAIMKASSLRPEATARERNKQIGGHRA
ncbi:MAG: DNA repair protein [Eggerthellaceae bacterium]|nr:DNA repair protein [Eggerthellaceae bacterium]